MTALAWVLPAVLVGGLGLWLAAGLWFEAWADRTQDGGVR
jgi:hypothetical protein